MNCSIIFSASPRSRLIMSIGMEFSSTMMMGSQSSSSITPRCSCSFASLKYISCISESIPRTGAYFSLYSLSGFSKMSFTSSYTPRTVLLIMDLKMRVLLRFPFSSRVISAVSAYLSSCAFSEHTPFERTSGSIGTTLSVKYTLVPRSLASSSTGVFCLT